MSADLPAIAADEDFDEYDLGYEDGRQGRPMKRTETEYATGYGHGREDCENESRPDYVEEDWIW